MGHWYTQEGEPMYTIVGKNGKERDTTLRDAKQLNLAPSVTTVDILEKPALVNWFVDQAIMSALTLSRLDCESDEAYLKRVKADSKEQGIKAATEGTLIHDACEQYYKSQVFVPAYTTHVLNVKDLIEKTFPDVTDWVAEKSFCYDGQYGGKVDLHSPSAGIVIDFKTKDKLDGKKLAYDQNRQLAAYQQGLRLKENVCANVFISRENGDVAIHVWSVEDIKKGRDVFNAVLKVWQLINLGASNENE